MRLVNQSVAQLRWLETHPRVGSDKWRSAYRHALDRLARRVARLEAGR